MARKTREKKPTTPKELMFYGVLLLAAAIGAYFYIGHAEQVGGTITLPIWLWPVYKAIGKLGIVAVLTVLGLLSLFGGIQKQRRAQAPAAAAGTSTTAPVPAPAPAAAAALAPGTDSAPAPAAAAEGSVSAEAPAVGDAG